MSERKKHKRRTRRPALPGGVEPAACGCVRGFRMCPEALALWEEAERAHAAYLAAPEDEKLTAMHAWDRAQAAFAFHAPLGPPMRG